MAGSTSVRQRCGPCTVSASEIKKNFKEQKLAAWQPLYSSGNVAIAFFVIGIFFLIFGTVITVYDAAVVEVVVDYTECNGCHTMNYNDTCQCNMTVEVSKKIPKPVYVQYQLDGFYQNHRRYVISRDDNQLLGKWDTKPSKSCAPYRTDAEGNYIVPCGAIANSLFNDTFELLSRSDGTLPILETGIAWASDKEHRFKNPDNWVEQLRKSDSRFTKPPSWSKNLWELDEENESNNGLKNEHLIVWMRTASLPNFRKPWGRIDHDQPGFEDGLPKGEYTLEISYNYPVKMFGGQKSFILTNTSVYGTLNEFLGIAYLLVGSVSMVIAGIFLILKLKSHKQKANAPDATTGEAARAR